MLVSEGWPQEDPGSGFRYEVVPDGQGGPGAEPRKYTLLLGY